ncbi:hypothetical protein AX15_004922 [Amanita polypyramis BW_CC]|nr:hypothetical protein AX15_004922 [Amanita polypyramis BW_CC]
MKALPGLSSSAQLALPVHIVDSTASSSVFHDLSPSLESSCNCLSPTHRNRDSSLGQPPHPFDSLPWITALDSKVDTLDMWDIADLSQLPVAQCPLPQWGRSSTRAFPTQHSNFDSVCAGVMSETTLTNHTVYSASSPSVTPPSRFDASNISFYHLMPMIDPTPHDMYEY